MKAGNSVLASYGTTVFEVMSRLAIEHKSINLGQGFPDEEGPDAVKAELDRVTRESSNQYPPMLGVPELRQAVAAHAKRFYGLDVDGTREVIVTSGATEALAACILSLVEPGDEVVLFEPLYDSYLPMLQRAGAVTKLVRLMPPAWEVPWPALEAAFTAKTKLLLLNTPMNPTGKVFTRAELERIARLVARHDTYAVCDEVYEHLVFDKRPHVPLLTLPGMRERVARIGSAGKTFSMTGWKVGYITAAPDLAAKIAKAHQFLVFTTPPNLQRAVAFGLDNEEPWYRGLAGELQAKRDYFADGLRRLGCEVLTSAGTYFVNADFRPLGSNESDVDLCRRLTVEAGVTPVPVSAFYTSAEVNHLARFSFCKKQAVLAGALDRLNAYFRKRTA